MNICFDGEKLRATGLLALKMDFRLPGWRLDGDPPYNPDREGSRSAASASSEVVTLKESPLIPQAFWFRMAMRCPRIDALPLPESRGRLLNLPEECVLPAFGRLEGRNPWAEVRAAWNMKGLAVSVDLTGKTGPFQYDDSQPDASDSVQLWVDTRDTRDVHRATKYCHRFAARLRPGRGENALEVYASQENIARALAEPPRARLDAIRTFAEVKTKPRGWLLEIFLKAEALNGFDPETNRRLGFMLQVTDPVRGDQFLGVGREFPVAEDPSLWTTLELVDKLP